MSTGFLFSFESKSACFADSRVVSLPEVLYTTHAHLDVLATNWAWHLSIDDNEIVIETLKTSKYRLIPILLKTYDGVQVITTVTSPISRFRQTFHIRHGSALEDDNSNLSQV